MIINIQSNIFAAELTYYLHKKQVFCAIQLRTHFSQYFKCPQGRAACVLFLSIQIIQVLSSLIKLYAF